MASKENKPMTTGKTTWILAGSTLLVFFIPELSEWLVYDRRAILEGQAWRLFTAPLVHFSFSHLFWDLLVFATAGWVIETGAYRGFRPACILAAFVPGPLLLLAAPELARYGGLSGLSTTAVVFLCLVKIKERRESSCIWVTLLLLTGLKIGVELVTAVPIFMSTTITGFIPLPSVHIIGCAAALAGWLLAARMPSRGRRIQSFHCSIDDAAASATAENKFYPKPD